MSELGRDAGLTFHPGGDKKIWKEKFSIGNVSIFDPTLCELMYKWFCDEGGKVLDSMDEKFDMVFSCPPYANLERYSDLPGDISNMDYPEFMKAYRSIVKKSCDKLKEGCMAVFVVGEVRGKDGNYLGFVPDTIQAFRDAGMHYYNEAVLLNSCGTAMFRVGKCMPTRKLVKTHQNVLVFKK